MSYASIEIFGPVVDNLVLIEISDKESRDSFYLDAAEVRSARDVGHRQVLDLVTANMNPMGYDILQAATYNGTTVALEGVVVDHSVIKSSLSPETVAEDSPRF